MLAHGVHAVEAAGTGLIHVVYDVAEGVMRPELHEKADGYEIPATDKLPPGVKGHLDGFLLGLWETVQHNVAGMGKLRRPFGGWVRVPWPTLAFASTTGLLVGGATAMAYTGWPASTGLLGPLEAMTVASLATTTGISAALLWKDWETVKTTFRRYGPEHTYLYTLAVVGPWSICLAGFKIGHEMAPDSALVEAPEPLPLAESFEFGRAMFPYAFDIPLLLAGLIGYLLAVKRADAKQREEHPQPIGTRSDQRNQSSQPTSALAAHASMLLQLQEPWEKIFWDGCGGVFRPERQASLEGRRAIARRSRRPRAPKGKSVKVRASQRH